jgi:hypothetical protein
MRSHNPTGSGGLLRVGRSIFLTLTLFVMVAGLLQGAEAGNKGLPRYQDPPPPVPTVAPPTEGPKDKPRRKPTRTPTIVYIPPTETLTPTITPEPSDTPSSTPSPTPTETLVPTETPTEQPTLVPAPSSTPLPIGDEAISKISINTLGIVSLVAAGIGLLLLVWNIRRSMP